MPKFIVKTEELVTGTYLVEADDEQAVRAKFGDPKIDWANVEQSDYQAFSCEVQSVTVTGHARPVQDRDATPVLRGLRSLSVRRPG